MAHDPLLQYEQTHNNHASQIKTKSRIGRIFRFVSLYLVLTGGIFALLMGLLNFSAYSAMVTNWVNPELMLTRQ